jgi:competence protein ComEC
VINLRFSRETLLWVFLFTLVLIRFQLTSPSYQEGQMVRISGRLMTEPIRYSDTQYFRFAGLKVYLPLYPRIYYGDEIALEGTVREGGLADPLLVDRKSGKIPLFIIRNSIIGFYRKSLAEPHSSLIAGIVLGAKSSLPEDFWEALKATGTAHVVVASGMNVSMTAGFVLGVLVGPFSRRRALIIALISIWIYTLMCGFDAPIVRAAIMGTIAFGAQGLGRLSVSLRALLLSGLLMLLINPGWAIDLGFILSFLATLGLILFEGKIRTRIAFVPGVFREGLSTSLAAQIAVAPVLYYVFGQFNPLSPLINALVLWTIAPIMVIGSISGLVGLLWALAGKVILFLAYPLTSWFVSIVKLMSF